MDGVGGRIVGHAEVCRPADVPETDIIVPVDGIGGEGGLLTADVECLVAGSGGEDVAQSRYQIFQLSARAVMSYAVEKDGAYSLYSLYSFNLGYYCFRRFWF